MTTQDKKPEHSFTKGFIYTDNDDCAFSVVFRKGNIVTFRDEVTGNSFRKKVNVRYIRNSSYEAFDISKCSRYPRGVHVIASGVLIPELAIQRAKHYYEFINQDCNAQNTAPETDTTPTPETDTAPAVATSTTHETASMIQFEIGKTYVSSECIKYTVIKRSDSFLTLQFQLPNGPVETIRKKINIAHDRERININNKYHYILANWIDEYHPSDVAPHETSQPTNNETAQQDTDSIIRFEVGKTYRGYTVVSRNDGRIGNLGSLWIVVTHNVDGISRPLHERRKAYSNTALNSKKGNSSEYFYEQNGRNPIFASEIDETDSTPDTNATVNAQQETTNDAKARNIFRSVIRCEISRENLENSLDTLTFQELATLLEYCLGCEQVPLREICREKHIAFSHLGAAHVCKTKILVFFDAWNNYIADWARKNQQDNARAVQNAIENAHKQDNGVLSLDEAVHALNNVMYSAHPGFTWQGYTLFGANACWKILSLSHILDLPYLAQYCTHGTYWGHLQFASEDKRINAFNAIRDEISNHIDKMNEGFDVGRYMGVYSVWQDNFNKHYKKDKYAQNGENDTATVQENTQQEHPSFTIVPSEHIERPEYASYPDTIPDDIPYHVIPAIDTPQPAAVITALKPAGLPRFNAAVVRTWLHFVAFFLKLWLLSRLPSVPHSIPETFKRDNPALIFRDTHNLKGAKLHKATARNARAVLNASSQEALTTELGKLSVSAVKRIGKCLGLLHQREKGNAQSLADTLSARLFEHRTAPPENSSAQQRQQPKTYTDCNGQIVIIFD